MKRNVFLVAAALLLSSCVSQPPLYKSTQSGKAEIVIPGVTVDRVRNEIVLACARNGGETESGLNHVICGKREEGGYGFAAQLLLGNTYSGTPYTKVKFTFAQTGDGVFVVADPWLEMTMGFGEVKRVPITNVALRNDLQAGLERAAENARTAQEAGTPPQESTQAPAVAPTASQAEQGSTAGQSHELDPAKRCDSCQRIRVP
jgi:hypothetical protein